MNYAMSNFRQQLIDLSQTYAAASGARGRDGKPSLTGVSTRIFNDGKTLTRVVDGGDVTTTSFEKALAWFSANWPARTKWPKGIVRPKPDEAA